MTLNALEHLWGPEIWRKDPKNLVYWRCHKVKTLAPHCSNTDCVIFPIFRFGGDISLYYVDVWELARLTSSSHLSLQIITAIEDSPYRYTLVEIHTGRKKPRCVVSFFSWALATIVDKNYQAPKFLNFYRAHGKLKTTTTFPVQCTICLFCAICILYKLDLCKLGGYFACTMDRTRRDIS